MSHLTTDQLCTLALDPQAAPVDPAKLEHMATCVACRDEFDRIRQLAEEFTLLRRSTPTAETMAQYAALFAHVEVRPSLLQRLITGLTAVLRWDSRQQPMLQGVRSGSAAAYRQLFATDRVELELLIEPQQQFFRLNGEIMAIEESEDLGLALIHLIDRKGRVFETQTEGNGRFHYAALPADTYSLIVSSPANDILEIEALEIG